MSVDDVLHDDEQLFERLSVALRVDPAPPSEPSAGELAFLAALVADRQTGRQLAGDVSSADRPTEAVFIRFARRRVQRYGSRLVAVVGAATILGSATAAAAASGKIDALRPLRQAEYDLGVPGVESPRLTDIRKTLDTLASARKNHDVAAQLAASTKLAQQYHGLDRAEQQDLVPVVKEQQAADPGIVEELPTTILEPATNAAPPVNDTTPPRTAPPDTAPPVTSPPGTAPPHTGPPHTAPPDTAPPDTAPPVTSPPDTAPPDTAPADTTPPATDTVPTTSPMNTAN